MMTRFFCRGDVARVAAVALLVGCRLVVRAGEVTTSSETAQVDVVLSFDAPKSYYEFDGKTLSWREPNENDTHYMKVLVRDQVGGQALPGCGAAALLAMVSGKAVGTSVTLHETWDGSGSHYGANVQVPDELSSGQVSLKLDPPKVRRLDREHGAFFAKSVVVKFERVEFPPKSDAGAASEASGKPQKIDWPEGRRPYAEPTPYPGAK